MSSLGKRSFASSGFRNDHRAKRRRMGNGKGFVTWTIYFGNERRELSVFQGTPLEDISKSIVKMTKYEEDKIECKNEEGAVIALTSHLPNGMEIFVEEILYESDDYYCSDDGRYGQFGHHNDNSNMNMKLEGDVNYKKGIKLRLALLGDKEAPLRIQISSTTYWSRIFEWFADYKRKEVHLLKFTYDGVRIRSDDLVMQYIRCEDYDDDEEVQIVVMGEQQGS